MILLIVFCLSTRSKNRAHKHLSRSITLERILVNVFAPQRGVTVAEDARERLSGACHTLTRAPGYANARSARTLFERWLIKQATLGAGDTLADAALEAALAEDNLASPAKRPMGFA